jgi:hypothetical protein
MARDGSWATIYGAPAGIGILPIALSGTDDEKSPYIPKLASAVHKCVQALAKEQEIIGPLSNIVMEVYALESPLLRAKKKIAASAAHAALVNRTQRELL